MRIIIEDAYLAEIYRNGKSSGKPKYGNQIEQAFLRRVIQIEQAPNTSTLSQIKSLHLELLKGDLKGKYSIRVKDGFRLIFRIENEGGDKRMDIIAIEELNNHYAK